jgi:hypothetical protein
VKPATAAQLLQRIRSLKATVLQTAKKLHRQKIELWMNIYLYFETRMAKDQYSKSEVVDELTASVGGPRGYWTRARHIGEFIRVNRLDCEEVWCSSLSKVGNRRINSKHVSRICRALERGIGPSAMDRLLCELGYRALPRIPEWNRRMIRRYKSTWTDWEKEMAGLVAGIKCTTDSKPKIELVLKVAGKEVVVVNGRG